MRVHQLERRLSHADVDFLGELKTAALLGLLEQAAVEASAAAGYDAARYTREHRMWLIRRTRLERVVPVGGTDTVTVRTEVADFRRARSLRRYEVRTGEALVARATTDWVYCDTLSGRPVRAGDEMRRALLDGDLGVSLPRADDLPSAGAGIPVDTAVTVQPSHLDHLVHVNNAVYASFLEDGAFALFAARGWPLARMLAAGGALRPRWLDAEYFSDAKAGDMLTVHTWLAAETDLAATESQTLASASLVQSITRPDHREVLRAESRWGWRRVPSVVGAAPPHDESP